MTENQFIEFVQKISADDLLKISPRLHQAVSELVKGCCTPTYANTALYNWDQMRGDVK